MEVSDFWSRLTHPLGGGEKEVLESLFRVPCGGLPSAPAACPPPELTVYDLSPLPVALLEERSGRDPGRVDRSLVEALGSSPVLSSAWTFEERPEGTRVKLTARLANLPPRGPTEALRRTLVFHLATVALALSRA